MEQLHLLNLNQASLGFYTPTRNVVAGGCVGSACTACKYESTRRTRVVGAQGELLLPSCALGVAGRAAGSRAVLAPRQCVPRVFVRPTTVPYASGGCLGDAQRVHVIIPTSVTLSE